MSDQFSYKNDELFAEDVSISTISKAVGTPFYLYSATSIIDNFLSLKKSLDGLENLICYAVKANSNIAILKLLSQLGAGMDVVSIGEYLRAKVAGVPGEKIVFSGVGKRRDEISQVLIGGIKQFNIESEAELNVLNEISLSLNKRTSITIRVNPDIDAKTHEKISTGKKDNKFGIPINRAREVYLKASQMLGVKVVGVDVHIGSQLTDLEPFRMAFIKVAELVNNLLKDGHEINSLDLGGGLGISYKKTNDVQPSLQEYGQIIRETVGSLGCEILVEPGRFIVGNAGILVSEIIYKKFGEDREFLIVDSAMNDLIRPSLYAAYHEILPIKEPNNNSSFVCYDVVGPVCETGDTFATQRSLMKMESGELLAFMSAGAYGSVMASEYNTRPLIPEVLVKGDNFSIIRARPLVEDIIQRDIVPDWV
ncbi:MAG: diaminopimelate decarboxylase [Rhodobacteraceae bacterium]|jgi:diaminopimelate decarboxylase|nr:diaminopimelate decarboxylase [Paracoccaceae bacterium]MBT6270895.1 diaminopimelate decarboxylase [Paracoccaceae bacterium]MDG1298645.1 diaminopimelate decarboxylase [Paracoccaceae bacterium]MDG2374666.1 diaminopimelate decarboxylase [Paracoccaceae bacterium]|tara:strand:+ start:15492 stop:16760 length:1269 start_codon:yes stop_codon:yes gene_type:complete